jgi:hypothetical protein
MPRLHDKDNLTNVRTPLATATAMVFTTLSLLMIPLGFACIAYAILTTLKGLRAATVPYEKIYWRLNLAAHLMFAYGVVVLTAMAVDSVLGEPWELSEWWPSISQYWSTAKNQAVVVLMDVLMVLGTAFCSVCLSRYFGHVDDNDVWHAPKRLNRKDRPGGLVFRERRARKRTSKHTLEAAAERKR